MFRRIRRLWWLWGAILSMGACDVASAAPGDSSLPREAAAPVLPEEDASPFSGSIDLKSSYTLSDYLYVATPDPVIQGWFTYEVGGGCSIGAWGSQSLGENVGNEVDLSASCAFDLGEGTEATVEVARYFLFDGLPDMTALSTSVRRGPIDAGIGVYVWDGGLEDGVAGEIGYTREVEGFTLRGSLHYATGLGDSDIAFAGFEASYPLAEHLMLSGAVYAPFVRADGDARKTRAVVGLSYSF